MELFDTHCHIQSAGVDTGEKATRKLWAKSSGLNNTQLVKYAQDSGVTRLLCVGCDLPDSKLAARFVQNQNNCWASVGIHPHEAQHYANDKAKRDEFAALVNQPKVVAIGECGLDFYYTHSSKEDQKKILRFQLELATQHNLPVVFHVREAFHDFWPIYDEYKNVRGVLHSFTDSVLNLTRAIERGLYIGVNGIATFTKDEAQLMVYKNLPLQKLLLETDAPFLTPTPYRGTINQPKNARVVAEFLSQLRGETLEQFAAVTTQNAQTLFGVK